MTDVLDLADGQIVQGKTPDEWAALVRADLGQAVAGFIAAGQHLSQAKLALGYQRDGNGFEAWVESEVKISASKARKLMAIGDYYGQDLFVHALPKLPDSWAALYELRALEPSVLESAIHAGHVSPDLGPKEASAFVVEYKRAAAVEAARSVQPGSWWQLGEREHLLYCGDSADPQFIGKARGVFTFADPPYNAGKAEWDEGFTWRHDYLSESTGIVAVTPGISAIPHFLAATTMPYRWSMAAWITNGMTRGALGFGNWIYVALFSTAESIHRNAQDFIKITVSPSAVSTMHESRKPAELVVSLLGTFTAEGDTVVDPFLGSGTTLFAAEQTGRRCIGAEIRPEFCAEIISRFGAEEARPL